MTPHRSLYGSRALTVLAMASVIPAQSQDAGSSRTLGFVIEALTPAFYQAPEGSECPDGLQLNELDMFAKAFPSKEAQADFIKKNGFYYFRGPHRENAWLYPERVTELRSNAQYFREAIADAGFKPLPGETPIVPIIVGETAAAIRMSDMLLEQGVFVTGFGFPVVPQGQARVRCQISAAHTRDDLDRAVDAFKAVGTKLGIIS